MCPDGTESSPEVALSSGDGFPMDAASTPSDMPGPHTNAKGVGCGQGQGRKPTGRGVPHCESPYS